MDSKISEKQMQKVRDILVGYFPDDLGHNADKFSAADDIAKEIIAALYSSQEPQKSEKQKVADLLGVPLSEVHTLDIQDGKLVEIVDVPQSVSPPTEGMELTQEQINIELFNYAYQIVTSNPIKDWNYNELIKQISQAQLAKVLSNLPTEQEIIEKTLREIDTKCAHVGLVGSGRENRIISADLWLKLSRQS